MKKIVSLILALCILFAFAVTAMADKLYSDRYPNGIDGDCYFDSGATFYSGEPLTVKKGANITVSGFDITMMSNSSLTVEGNFNADVRDVSFQGTVTVKNGGSCVIKASSGVNAAVDSFQLRVENGGYFEVETQKMWSFEDSLDEQGISYVKDGNKLIIDNREDPTVGSAFSEGNYLMIAIVCCVGVVAVAAIVIANKKKKAVEAVSETAETEETKE